MKKYLKKAHFFDGIIYATTLGVFIKCLFDKQSTNMNFVMYGSFLIGCIAMGIFSINSGKELLDLTDAIIAFVFISFGRREAVIFTVIYWIVISFVDKKIHRRRNNNIIFNICMMTINTFTAATIIMMLDYFNNNLLLISPGFVGIFLIINVLILKISFVIKEGRAHKIGPETRKLLLLNFAVSSIITFMLGAVWQTRNYIGNIIILINLVIPHYCFYIYRKLQFRNEGIKKLLKITRDMAKYGDFSDKCSHLISNLKELIPYEICALYTFDVENDSVIYPVSYVAPECIGIGELAFDISSEGITAKVVREGKVYISKETKKDKRIRLTGKLAEITETAVFVPITMEDRVVGIIFISGGQDLGLFIENGVEDILAILSNQMVLAIENDGIYRELKNKAEVDHLTKLYNRRVFEREVDELISTETMFSMVIYDIDNFKIINDTYGHLVGDEVLKLVSGIVKKSIRKTDIACRYGGEEIVIVFRDLSQKDAYIISDRIRDKINSASIDWYGKEIKTTVSGGVASYPDNGTTMNEIIEHADEVLYKECKNMGKNKVCSYSQFVEKQLRMA